MIALHTRCFHLSFATRTKLIRENAINYDTSVALLTHVYILSYYNGKTMQGKYDRIRDPLDTMFRERA